MIDIDSAVEQVQRLYATAAYERDVARFMQVYDASVRVFDAWGTWEYAGAEAWQRAVEGWFNSLGTERVKVTFEATQVFGSAAAAFSSSIVTYAGLAADGRPLRAMQNRLTWGLRTSGHVLRVLHEHTSAPIGFDDMKAILQRRAAS